MCGGLRDCAQRQMRIPGAEPHSFVWVTVEKGEAIRFRGEATIRNRQLKETVTAPLGRVTIQAFLTTST